ncbi:MAG: ribonuclease Y [Clostridiales bacterium]|nr:ribonuclease Y [Clostridiales bacterium]MBE7101234.1 ribonuclease Y [Clostridiales bacterium]
MQNVNLSVLFLASAVNVGVAIGIAVAALLVGCIVSVLIYKAITKKKVGSAKEQVGKILSDAKAEADQIKAQSREESKRALKEALLEAKEQDLKLRNEFERDTKEKKAEIQRMEQRLTQKEDALEKKTEALEQQKANLHKKEEEIEVLQQKLSSQHELMIQELEKVAQLSKEEAKKLLTEEILDETRHDVAIQVRNLEQQAKDEADMNAKKIISLAIQKCAADQASEITVSVVPLPNDDMKARIIGREGRNIRALENATGIELIIDDTPEVVILSGFDPVRREIARLSLEKLINDGRIHPARIEETVEKVSREMDMQIKEAGEAAVFEAGIFGLHPELIKLIGRLKFRTSYGQNVYKHSVEVSMLAGMMAAELGLDVNFAKRAGLLHDIGKAVDQEQEGTHIQIGADLAKKYKENANIVNAIMAHHGDVEPKTIEAVLIQAADAISGARPGARREMGSNYVKRLERLEEIASSFHGVEKSYAIQAGREVRVIVKPEQVDDAQAMFLAKDIAKKIETELEYPGQIKVNVIREFRGVEYAK